MGSFADDSFVSIPTANRQTFNVAVLASTGTAAFAERHLLAEQVRHATSPRCLDLRRVQANEYRNRRLQFASLSLFGRSVEQLGIPDQWYGDHAAIFKSHSQRLFAHSYLRHSLIRAQLQNTHSKPPIFQ